MTIRNAETPRFDRFIETNSEMENSKTIKGEEKIIIIKNKNRLTVNW